MASSSGSLLVRSKSARLNPNLGPKPGPATRQVGPGLPAFPAVVPAATPMLSNVDLFLANLRVLDLDLLPDWPGIKTATFSSSSASQGQKKRIQCVEWSLYQLMQLWDEDEAKKLRPFFPPGDQVQSLNLRAGLLRCLEQAKKNGVLGRDTVIRKTMLDECKGERLEEVLASFSFAVLRKAVAHDTAVSGHPPAVAQALALENRGYAGERTEVSVLALAHQASLGRMLRQRRDARARFDDFADLLDVKERGIARRREQVRSIDARNGGGGSGSGSGSQGIGDDEKLDVWRLVRNNWAGNERWMETLLYGDANARRDGLLTTPFDKVWRRVQAGRLSELEDHGTGLLEQLEGRARMQRDRLQKWQDFRKRAYGGSNVKKEQSATSHEEAERRKGLGLRFDRHHDLNVGRMSPRKARQAGPMAQLKGTSAELVAAFEEDMKNAGKTTGRPMTELLPRKPLDRTRLSAEAHSEGAISELSELEDEVAKPSLGAQGSRNILTGGRLGMSAIEYERELVTDEAEEAREAEVGTPQARHAKSVSKSGNRSASTSPTKPPRARPHRSPTKSPPKLSPKKSPTKDRGTVSPIWHESPEEDQPPPSPTQAQADEILASMNVASSPSPTRRPKLRHTLSLAERTRLTMSRKSTKQFSSDEEDGLPAHREAAAPPQPRTPSPNKADDDNDNDAMDAITSSAGYENLVARTRKSMAGFEAARQKAQLERRKSQRKSRMPPRREGSYFPRLSEDAKGEGEDTTMIAAELMEGEQNYEDVFKSRPKIKASPVPSPTREWDD